MVSPNGWHGGWHRSSFSARVTGACAYTPPIPTAPTEQIVVATPADAVSIGLSAGSPDFATGAAVIAVRTRGADGDHVGVDVECTTSSGLLLPGKFSTKFIPSIELSRTVEPATVRCHAGMLTDTITVDMSAWWVDLSGNQFVSIGPGAGESRIFILPLQRIARVPATRVTIDWGDGTVEALPFIPVRNPGDTLSPLSSASAVRRQGPSGLARRVL